MIECPSCGRELAKDMMFCPYCGTKIQPESFPLETDGQDQVVGVIPLALARDGEEGRMFTLIITKFRLIFARTTEEDENKIRKASGSILLGGSILEPERHRKSLGAYSRRYQSMDPEEITAKSGENDNLKIREVDSIRISSEENTEGEQFYLLSLETQKGSRKFLIPNDKDSRDLLISTFGDRVRW